MNLPNAKEGGSVFPFQFTMGDGQGTVSCQGMTVRYLTALVAMHAEISTAGMAKPAAVALAQAALRAGRTVEEQISHNAFAIADQMIMDSTK